MSLLHLLLSVNYTLIVLAYYSTRLVDYSVIVVILINTLVYLDLLLYQFSRVYMDSDIIVFSTNIYSYNRYDLMHYFTLFHYNNYTFLRFYINF